MEEKMLVVFAWLLARLEHNNNSQRTHLKEFISVAYPEAKKLLYKYLENRTLKLQS